jgi:2-aminoadipate transaminase
MKGVVNVKYNFSNRINAVKPSAVGNVLKMMGDPTLISFAGGNPAPDSFPVEKIREISDELLSKDPIGTLQYSITEGYPDLIKEATKFINRDMEIVKNRDSMIITSGSQQIVDFSIKILCNEGDVVLAENPSFMAALDSIRSNGACLEGIKMDSDGVNLEDLEAKISAKIAPKVMYLIPNFQNPTGITMSFEKRKAAYALAVKHGVIILEDNPYGELRFSGDHIPPIKSLDKDGIVIYAASLSKIMSPGMRVACAVGPSEIMNKFKTAKMVNDVHSAVWGQRVCERILATYDMRTHLEKLKNIYGSKSKLVIDTMEKEFHPDVTFTHPDGGMFIWVTLPEGVNMQEFVKAALNQKVALVPGNAFCIDSSLPCQSFRISFSTPSEENIIKGLKILGKLTYEFCNSKLKSE